MKLHFDLIIAFTSHEDVYCNEHKSQRDSHNQKLKQGNDRLNARKQT